jgi:hypothetical protein
MIEPTRSTAMPVIGQAGFLGGRAAAQDRCRWGDRPRRPQCRHGAERPVVSGRQHQAGRARRGAPPRSASRSMPPTTLAGLSVRKGPRRLLSKNAAADADMICRPFMTQSKDEWPLGNRGESTWLATLMRQTVAGMPRIAFPLASLCGYPSTCSANGVTMSHPINEPAGRPAWASKKIDGHVRLPQD